MLDKINWRIVRQVLIRAPKQEIEKLIVDLIEFSKILRWYFAKKLRFLGVSFEESKGIVVDILMARRGAYQRPFLHFGMVALAVVAIFFAPVIVSQYPTARAGSLASDQESPSAVLKMPLDVSSTDVATVESQKPRRDVIEHVVASGETLSTIAKNYNVDTDSINALNKFDPSHILHPGDTIKIPPVSGVIVTVASGDTVYSLAKKYGIPSAQAIVDWPYNTFVDDEKFSLAAGQTLVIPGGVLPEEAPAPRPIQKTPDAQLFVRGSGQLSWPTVGVITQYFAFYHNGLDIASNSSPSINAADSGRVVSVLYQNHDYGFHVIIDHGNGYRTLYGHMSRIDVSEGQNVSRGQHIGYMGSTGRSTGPHLHFTVYLNGNAVNPLGLLR